MHPAPAGAVLASQFNHYYHYNEKPWNLFQGFFCCLQFHILNDCIIASFNIQIDNNCSWVNYCIGIYEAPLIASNKKASLKARPCIKHFVIYFFFVSARPNGLFFAKSTNTGAATKIDE